VLRFLGLAAGVAIGVGLFLGGKWYVYVTATANPHDAEGTSLNAAMPEGLNRWGCAKLRVRFPDANAPEGCKAADGVSWRG
jgi:hypothetical protein